MSPPLSILLLLATVAVASAARLRQGSTILDAASTGDFTATFTADSLSPSQKKCKGKEGADAIECCFNEEGRREKERIEKEMKFNVVNGVFDMIASIPGVGDLAEGVIEAGKSTAKIIQRHAKKKKRRKKVKDRAEEASAITSVVEGVDKFETELDELDEDDCHQVAAQQQIAALGENKEITQEMQKDIGKIDKQITEISETVNKGLSKMDETQSTLIKMEARLDEQLNALMKSSNTLAAKLDRLSLKVIENGERIRQSAYGQLAIEMGKNIGAISQGYSTVLRFTAEVNAHKQLMSKALKVPGRAKKMRALLVWLKSYRAIVNRAQETFETVWATTSEHFVGIAAALSEGNFLSYHFREVFRVEVEKWISEKLDSKSCSELLTDKNVKELIERLKELLLKDGSMVNMIAHSINRLYFISTIVDAAFSFDKSARTEFVTTLASVSGSLQTFTKHMKSEKIFGEELSQILSVLLPASCTVEPECKAAAFEAGHANTDQMIRWTRGWPDKNDPRNRPSIIALNPSCRLFSPKCEVPFFECKSLPWAKDAPDKQWRKIKMEESGKRCTDSSQNDKKFCGPSCTTDDDCVRERVVSRDTRYAPAYSSLYRFRHTYDRFNNRNGFDSVSNIIQGANRHMSNHPGRNPEASNEPTNPYKCEKKTNPGPCKGYHDAAGRDSDYTFFQHTHGINKEFVRRLLYPNGPGRIGMFGKKYKQNESGEKEECNIPEFFKKPIKEGIEIDCGPKYYVNLGLKENPSRYTMQPKCWAQVTTELDENDDYRPVSVKFGWVYGDTTNFAKDVKNGKLKPIFFDHHDARAPFLCIVRDEFRKSASFKQIASRRIDLKRLALVKENGKFDKTMKIVAKAAKDSLEKLGN